MTRKNLLKRMMFIVCLIFVLFIIGFYSFLAFANDPRSFWRTVNGAHVTLNGRSVPEAHLYRRPNGMLLMDLGDDNGWQLYRPDFQSIYWCNPIKHVSIPGYIYARNCDSNFCPCVRMGSVKTEVDAQLKVEPNSIEFNSRDGLRLRVFW
jgi:hypothetical protein